MISEYYQDEDANDDGSVEYYAVRPNKTRIKKEIAAVFALSEQICQLAPAQIAELGLPEDIQQALLDAAKMGRNAARKRLLKYITGQLRQLDQEGIREKLARMTNQSAHATREHHQAERWRDVLLADTEGGKLTQFIDEFPDADSGQIRQLQRNARKEAGEGKPPRSARLLYRYLKDIMAGE